MTATNNWWGNESGPSGGDDYFGNVNAANPVTSRSLMYSRSIIIPFYVTARNNEARYAINTSRANFTDTTKFPSGAGNLTGSASTSVGGSYTYSFLDHVNNTGSGLFISESLFFGGGMPMTVGSDLSISNCDPSPIEPIDRWRVCCGASGATNKEATKAWRDHVERNEYFVNLYGAQALSDITSPSPVDTIIYNDLEAKMRFEPSGGGMIGGGTWRPGFEISGPQYLYDLFNVAGPTSGPLSSVNTGDMVFIDTSVAHSFVIVGWGPALNCPQALNAQEGANFWVQRKNNGAEIPYIADFCYGFNSTNNRTGWLQDPRPRPFYCSAAEINTNQLSDNLASLGFPNLVTYQGRLRGSGMGTWLPFVNPGNIRPAWKFFRIPIIQNNFNRVFCPAYPCP